MGRFHAGWHDWRFRGEQVTGRQLLGEYWSIQWDNVTSIADRAAVNLDPISPAGSVLVKVVEARLPPVR